MKKVPAKGAVTKGLDCSHYDGLIDFEKVKESGREFVFVKCTEYSEDSYYPSNKKNAEAAGLVFGAYHFFHPSKDPNHQADQFLKDAGLKAGDLPAMFDWETADNMPSMQDKARAKAWLDTVEKATGKPPMIYSGPYFLAALALDQSFKRYPLVIAHYKVSAPLVPFPWENWAFWQISDKGDVPGIPMPDEDLDVFNGTLEELRKILL